MGADYYLVNTESKTFFNLGKGCWCDILGGELHATMDLEYLEELLFADFYGGCEESSKEGVREAAHDLAAKIFEMAKCLDVRNLRVCIDCTDDPLIFKFMGFRCVGSRYQGFDPVESNKHLTSEVQGWKPSASDIERFSPRD
jgi:hypothetical protein